MSMPDHIGDANKMVIDDAYLAERERIWGAATKGYQSGVLQGWRWRKHGFAHMPWQVHAPNKFDMADLGTVAFAVERDDATAIVDAVNTQPALIAEIRRLRKVIEDLTFGLLREFEKP